MKKPVMILVGAVAIFALGAGVYAYAPSKNDAQTAATSKNAKGEKSKGEKSKGEKKGGAGEEEKGHGEEGAVEMNDARVASSNIEILAVGPETLRDSLPLNGILQPNQEALVQVTPRFPGIVREIKKRIGDNVEKGELLAKIESNQSLTVYEIRAPISGTVIDRQISLGEYASEQKPAADLERGEHRVAHGALSRLPPGLLPGLLLRLLSGLLLRLLSGLLHQQRACRLRRHNSFPAPRYPRAR